MSGLDACRIAEIIVSRTDDTLYRGSGYLIAARTVLTARHVVANAAHVIVRFNADREDMWEALAATEWAGDNYDLAILTLATEGPNAVRAAGFAQVGDGCDEIAVHTAGFPKWKMRPEPGGTQFRELHHASGTVAPISNRRTGTLEITLRAPAESTEPDSSQWEAMSGAAVWAKDRIIGVVVEHHPAEGAGRLTGLRIGRAFRDGVARDGRRLSDVLGIDPHALPDVTLPMEAPPRDVALPSLQAYRIPTDWRPDDGPCPIGDAHRADLGALLCLDRGPGTTVVAARAGTPLAEALTAVEEGPIRSGAGPGHDFPERVWSGVRAGDAEAALRGSPAGPAAVGLVVRWPVGTYPGGLPVGRSVRELRARIDATVPGTPVVVLVEADEPIDSIAAATWLGRELDAARTGPPVEVFAHVRPGDPDPDPGPGAGAAIAAPDVGRGANPHALMATVADRMRARSLPAPPYPSDGEPLPAGADPETVAADLVSLLNQAAPWGPPEREAHAIRLVRDYAPRYFLPLLRRHARDRSGDARWASLSAAAAVDDHVTAWLDAVPEIGPPLRVPRRLRDRVLVEGVLLGLLRFGADGVRAWVEAAAHGRSPGAVAVAEFLASGRPAAEFLPEASAESAIAAVRAGQHHLLTVAVAAPEASEAWWAVVGRLPLTARTVRTLAALSVESRRIAGFAADQREPDADFAELTYQMRTAMRPPPARGLMR